MYFIEFAQNLLDLSIIFEKFLKNSSLTKFKIVDLKINKGNQAK
jgi:hypothetical protein